MSSNEYLTKSSGLSVVWRGYVNFQRVEMAVCHSLGPWRSKEPYASGCSGCSSASDGSWGATGLIPWRSSLTEGTVPFLFDFLERLAAGAAAGMGRFVPHAGGMEAEEGKVDVETCDPMEAEG